MSITVAHRIFSIAVAVVAIVVWFLSSSQEVLTWGLVISGTPLVINLLKKLFHGDFGSDLLAGIAIVTSGFVDQALAGCLVVIMLSGGELLEEFALRNASSALRALIKRSPNTAHRPTAAGLETIDASLIDVGERIVVLPHEACPVDGTVVDGNGWMDEAYLTGEPYRIAKAPGSEVVSGAINGESVLTVQTTRPAHDSRYAKIIQVMKAAEEERPHIRRIAERLGAFYTPLAVGVAVVAWMISGDPLRFLAVLVIATPCPLLLAIPVAIIGSVSLAAKRGIVVRSPAVLETAGICRTLILDKTGTLTYGEPSLTDVSLLSAHTRGECLQLAASLEQYSKHPLAVAVISAAQREKLVLLPAVEVAEPPGVGIRGIVGGHEVRIASRKLLAQTHGEVLRNLPPVTSGLECLLVVDGVLAACLQFHDGPRKESRPFIQHLERNHRISRVMIVTGDRESEAQHLAQLVGIENVHASKSPEEKVAIVRAETSRAGTIFVGDGINDAPALLTASVGLAFGPNSDVTANAAGAVILTPSLAKVDEFLHISTRMRRIAQQSAVGGMTFSALGMIAAAFGALPPVSGAILQEVIDVIAILNALRAAWPPETLTDY